MNPFKRMTLPGSPWIDYQEKTKATIRQSFVFHIENFLAFSLSNITVSYPCQALGFAQPDMTVRAVLASRAKEVFPIEVPPGLFSSPSQNFRLGTLDELPQGQKLKSEIFNFPCDYGDTITVHVSGAAVGILVQCMIVGRKYKR